MPLPIIIKLERHWDEQSKKTLIKSLPSLSKLGYDQLCFEVASDKSEEQTIYLVKETVKFSQNKLLEAKTCLQKKGIAIPDWSQTPISDLESLLLRYVTTQYSSEMALWFKELPGHQKTLQLIAAGKQLNMSLKGVDLPEVKLSALNKVFNLSKRVQVLDLLDDDRIHSFKTNLLQLQNEGRGVIFTVGKEHFEKLVTAFMKEGCLTDVIFIYPYSPKNLELKDSELVKITNENCKAQLTLIEKEIHSEEDMDEIISLLQRRILSKISMNPYLIKHWESSQDFYSFFAEGKIKRTTDTHALTDCLVKLD